MSIPISVIIPCRDDVKIADCLQSVDVPVEIVVSLNAASSGVRETLSAFPRVRIVETTRAGIGLAYNRGIAAATNPWILLMDSDCVFVPGTIRRLWQLSGDYRIVKGRVAFRSSSILTRMTALLREYTTSDHVSAYSPPLLFAKEIEQQIGYFFHPALVWGEDGDFDRRVRAEGLPIGYDHDAIVWHEALSVRRDLRSAFWYGVGRQIGKEVGVYEPHTFQSRVSNIVKVFKTGYDVSCRKGLLAALYYLVLWNPVFRLGTLAQKWLKWHRRD